MSHGFGGGVEEMLAVLPRCAIAPGQSQPGFMHERGGLERLAGRLLRHFARDEPAQLFIDSESNSSAA